MPDKKGRFTAQERKFIVQYAATGDGTLSAKTAGYAAPHISAGQKLANPDIMAEIQRLNREKMAANLPLAWANVHDFLGQDPERTNIRTRWECTKWLIDRSKADEGAEAKPVEEMSAEEVAVALAKADATLAALELIAAERAKVVSPEDNSTESSILD